MQNVPFALSCRSSIPFSMTIRPARLKPRIILAFHHAHPAVAAIEQGRRRGKAVDGANCRKHKGLSSHVEFPLLR